MFPTPPGIIEASFVNLGAPKYLQRPRPSYNKGVNNIFLKLWSVGVVFSISKFHCILSLCVDYCFCVLILFVYVFTSWPESSTFITLCILFIYFIFVFYK